VRLDHLLSKEHLAGSPLPVGVSVGPELCSGRDGRPLPGGHGVSGTVLEGGTLTSSAGTMVPLLVRLFLQERGTWWGVGSGGRHAVGS